MRLDELADKLSAVGYTPRRRELLALSGALQAPEGAGARALLLEGPPGAGKSALAEAVASAFAAPLVVAQLHAWSDADELFVGLDVASAVAGDAERVRQDGVLAVVARAAEEAPLVVLLLDEMDKSSERCEALLLDWLQTGRVPLRPGFHLRTRLERVLVLITSNGQRPLGDALLRRVRRVRMEPLPTGVAERLIEERTGSPRGLVILAWRAARAIAEGEGTQLSLQEGVRLLCELRLAQNVGDCRESLAGWAARTPEGAEIARRFDCSALWAELKKAPR